jgi:hypothetical protein
MRSYENISGFAKYDRATTSKVTRGIEPPDPEDCDKDPDLLLIFFVDRFPTLHFDACPDPNFYFVADPVQTFHFDADPIRLFIFIRILFRLFILMGIQNIRKIL